jgi:hypothetical protein
MIIEHRHITEIEWAQWGRYSSEESAQKAFDQLGLLQKLRPSTGDGINFHNPLSGYLYRLR